MKGRSGLAFAAALAALSITSCDKTKELYQSATDKFQELRGSEEDEVDETLVKEVTTVSDTEGKSVIQNERRLVMLEFYTDT